MKLAANGTCAFAEIYDTVTTKSLVPISLCCLNVYQQNNFGAYYKSMQSKPVILCDNEKAYRRIDAYNSACTNRQFFVLYNMLSGAGGKAEARGFVCVHRLNAAERTLHVHFDEEAKPMVEIVNLHDGPMYIWPRLMAKVGRFGVSNMSLEAYLIECEPNWTKRVSSRKTTRRGLM